MSASFFSLDAAAGCQTRATDVETMRIAELGCRQRVSSNPALQRVATLSDRVFEEKGRTLGLDENRQILRRTYEKWWNCGDLELVDEMVAPDYVDHSLEVNRVESAGRSGLKELIAEYRRGFPDMVEVLEDVIAEGDKVVGRFRMRGTHTGSFLGIAATGRQVEMTGIDIYRITIGKIVEMWYNEDLFGIMMQLGVVPVSPQRILSSRRAPRLCVMKRSRQWTRAPEARTPPHFGTAPLGSGIELCAPSPPRAASKARAGD
jgi:predicted ester cyclase